MQKLAICCLTIIAYGCTSNRNPIHYVDPFIGTDATHFISEWRSEG